MSYMKRGVYKMSAEAVILGIVVGTLGAIVYSLRILVLMERRIARIDSHIEALVLRVLEKEEHIEAEEQKIEELLGVSVNKAKSSSKKAKKSSTKSSAKSAGQSKASKSKGKK